MMDKVESRKDKEKPKDDEYGEQIQKITGNMRAILYGEILDFFL